MKLEEKLKKALEVSKLYWPQDILEAIQKGKMQAWTQGDTLVVTTINEFPRMKVCDGVVAAGNLKDFWEIHDEQIVPFAKRHGCARIRGMGRPGWTKEAMKHGYDSREAHVIMEL